MNIDVSYEDRVYTVFTKPFTFDGPNAQFSFIKFEDGTVKVSGYSNPDLLHLFHEMMELGMSKVK